MKLIPIKISVSEVFAMCGDDDNALRLFLCGYLGDYVSPDRFLAFKKKAMFHLDCTLHPDIIRNWMNGKDSQDSYGSEDFTDMQSPKCKALLDTAEVAFNLAENLKILKNEDHGKRFRHFLVGWAFSGNLDQSIDDLINRGVMLSEE